MPIDQHPRRRTPEQIVADQKQQAETERRRKLATSVAPASAPPTTVPATARASSLATTDTRTVPERLADELSSSFMPGPPIKFDGKIGQFVTPGNGELIDEKTRYAARVPEIWNGRLKFNGEGEQPTRVGGFPYDGYEMPERETLGDNDPDEWPTGLNGKPSDPWLHEILLPIQNIETGEVFCFGTTSATGRTAVGSLLRAYNRMRRANQNEIPIIQLKPSSYEHRTFGKVNVPSFVIVGRTNLDGTKPDTATADMSDAIPEF